MAARARAMAITDADYAKEEARRKAGEEAKIVQEKQQEQGLQNQVGNYLVSLRESYGKLREDYNAILKVNPQDPKLREIYNQLSAVRSEIQRVMMDNHIKYKD